MPFRIYQGKEVLTSTPLVLPRGQIFVDLNTLEAHVGDGSTPGGVPLGTSGGGTNTGTVAFSQLVGQISEIQIPSGLILNSQLRTDTVATATWLLSANAQGGFAWVNPASLGGGGGGGSLALVATTGNYDDLSRKPVFGLGNLRTTNTVVSAGSFAEGSTYQILSVNGTNFTLIGAANNNVGTIFTATGSGNGNGSGTAYLRGRFAPAITANYLDLLDTPTLVSQFINDAGYVNTLTLATYVTTSQVTQLVGDQIDAAIASSGTFYNVLQELTAASTNTSVTTALSNRLRIDINTQNLTTQQKANGVTNLGLATVAVSGSYNDLTDLPEIFQIQAATISQLGGVIVGDGLSVDNTGRVSVNTQTVKVSLIPPNTLKGQVGQEQGQLRADQNFLYFAKSAFNPSIFQASQTASSNTNVVVTIASQWLAQIDNAKATYQSGQWRMYDSDKNLEWPITNISTSNGTAYFTIDAPGGVTYTTSDQFYVQKDDTWSRISEMDSYGTISSSVGGLSPTSVSGTINLPLGQTYGTTSTMMTIDCTGVTYGQMAVSFVDTNNTEYYNGTIEIHLYPDLTYIIQPNLSGNKTDRIAVGFTSETSAVYQTPALIKIPVYNTDKNIANNLTQSTCTITTIKYSWLVRTNI